MDQVLEPMGAAAASAPGAQPVAVNVAPAVAGKLRDYIALMRLDHMTKHVFILPGIALAFVLRQPPLQHVVADLLIGFVSAVMIASANYVINEWLDREFDAYHPVKAKRAAVSHQLSGWLVLLQYCILACLGLALASTVGSHFFVTSIFFLGSGLIYNVKPLRTKDRVYLDVISESVNNPIRLMLGWTMIAPVVFPPSSLLLGYWFGGAFLMAAKRVSEFRDISDVAGIETLRLYRRSFGFYTSENLLGSTFLYAMLSAFFLAIFFIRYRLEYMVACPFIAILFTQYFWLALQKNSVAQRPERLFRSRRLMVASLAVLLALTALTFIDLPFLNSMTAMSFQPVGGP